MGVGQSMNPSLAFRIVKDKEEAHRLLYEAEQKDFYMEECREDYANSRARWGTDYRAREMSEEEEAFFKVVVENARDEFPLRLRTEITKPVQLVALERSAEGGMPHTRPDHIICYPDIYKTFSVSTLLHELWHVHQREQIDWWKKVFLSIDWEPWISEEGTSETLPLSLESHRRFNPDTLDSPLWCFRRTWVPVPIFREVVAPKVGEVDIWFYHIHLKYHVKRVPRELLEEYHESLPASAYEHPREIAAYLLSEPTRYEHSPAFRKLREAVGGISLPINRLK